MPKISVIMPCLNMANYIDECICSVMEQTLEDIEILVVDAGSTDGTMDILKRYAARDSRIEIIHSGRRSYGYQVNIGIEAAKGEFVAIVDTDDRIVRDMYEALYIIAMESGADYVKGTAEMFYTLPNGWDYRQPIVQFPKETYGNGGLIEICPHISPWLLTTDNYLWDGIFRKDFIETAAIRLHESPGAAFQDFGGLLQTQIRAQKAVYLEKNVYEYRQDNMMASGYSPKGFQFVWDEYSWAERFVEDTDVGWKDIFYKKFFIHARNKYYAMARSGMQWDGVRLYIDLVKEKLYMYLCSRKENWSDIFREVWDDLNLFLVDEDSLYDKYVNMFLAKKRDLIYIQKLAQNREIVIFGCGRIGRFVHAQILRHNLGRIAAFCDNNAEKQIKFYGGVPIVSPVDAARLYLDACFVIANQRDSEDMEQQLVILGIPKRQIYHYTAGMDMHLFSVGISEEIQLQEKDVT